MPADEGSATGAVSGMLNMSAIAPYSVISVVPREHDDDRQARISREAQEEKFDLVRRYTVLGLVVAGLVGVALLCAFFIASPSAAPDERQSGRTVLSALFTGGLSFQLGQASARK